MSANETLSPSLTGEAERAATLADARALGAWLRAGGQLLERVGTDAINRCLGTTAPRTTDYTPRTLTIPEALALVVLERWRAAGAPPWALETMIGAVLEEQYGPAPYTGEVGAAAIAAHDLAVKGARGEAVLR